MSVLSAALGLFAIFLILIICLPIILLFVLFFGYDKLSPKIREIFFKVLNWLAKLLKINIKFPTTSKKTPKKSRKAKSNVSKPDKVTDAEFREIS